MKDPISPPSRAEPWSWTSQAMISTTLKISWMITFSIIARIEDGYNYDTELKKFEAKVSKNGDKVKVKWDSEGTWYDFDKDKDRKVKTKLKANLDKSV